MYVDQFFTNFSTETNNRNQIWWTQVYIYIFVHTLRLLIAHQHTIKTRAVNLIQQRTNQQGPEQTESLRSTTQVVKQGQIQRAPCIEDLNHRKAEKNISKLTSKAAQYKALAMFSLTSSQFISTSLNPVGRK